MASINSKFHKNICFNRFNKVNQKIALILFNIKPENINYWL